MENTENVKTNENIEEQVNLTPGERREQAFMLLFSRSFDDETLEEAVKSADEMFIGGVCAYARAAVGGIETNRDEIDKIISSHLKSGWTLSRISKPSLAILRLAVYEMKYLSNVPQSVSINEAVELAKKYTIDESGFVNGVLGACARELSEN